MDIFVIDINDISQNTLDCFIRKYDKEQLAYKNELKQKQHYSGLYLFHYVAKKFYNLNNPELEFKNNKPFIKNSDWYLSISHSKNIVVIAFEKSLLGIDIEYNKQKRDFLKVAQRCFSVADYASLKQFHQEEQQKIFYELWTKYEANIKLGNKNEKKYFLTDYFIDDFTFSAVSEVPLKINSIEFINNRKYPFVHNQM